jgi:hypothetical protein
VIPLEPGQTDEHHGPRTAVAVVLGRVQAQVAAGELRVEILSTGIVCSTVSVTAR